MPHSSGGGSHGGGSHGGSHSSSHGGSRGYKPDPHPVKNTYYTGARRYRYRRFGRTRYIYCNDDPKKRFSYKRLLVLLFYVPFLAGIYMGVGAEVQKTIQQQKGPVDNEIIVSDEADVLDSQEERTLRDTLNMFYNKSGIVPAVVTVKDEDWVKQPTTTDTVSISYGTKEQWLESYAYERYLSEFRDESHWLIVYSKPADENDWHFEGMQGNDTDNVLTENITSCFNSRLTMDLEAKKKTVGGCLQDSFDYIMPMVKKPGLMSVISNFLPALFVFLFLFVHAYFMAGLYELKYRKAEYDPDPNENEQLRGVTPSAPSGYGTQQTDTGYGTPQIGLDYGTPVNMNNGYAQNQYASAGSQYQTGYDQNGYQYGYQNSGTSYAQNNYGTNSTYGQSSYQSYGNGYQNGYGDLMPGVSANHNSYGQGTQNQSGFGQSSASSYSYGNASDSGSMPEIGLPQPVPPGCTTCSSCGNVYHVAEGRCNLCGGK